jgi:sensor histidine kinase YesM
LLLKPLVENAFQHGIGRRTTPCDVCNYVRRECECLVI